MKMRRLGNTGLKVSEICLGTMTFGAQCDEATSFSIIEKAVEGGVNFIDTADVYPVPPEIETAGRTEEIVGRWLVGKRDKFVLATKCRARVGAGVNDEGLSRKHILAAAAASLKRLQTDYIDLYQAHSPDPDTPLEETLRAFDDLVDKGYVRYIGCSNYPAWQLAMGRGLSQQLNLSRFDSVQPRYNILHRDIETELVPLCMQQGIGIIAYNPLAGGFLSGKHQNVSEPTPGTRFALGRTGELYRERYWEQAQWEAVARLRAFLAPSGRSMVETAVAWVLGRPGITSAIVGATRAEQLSASLAASTAVLSDEVREFCDALWFELPRRRMPSR